MLVVFVLNEVRQPEPVLDFSLFRIGGVAPALAASLLQGLGSFALLFLVIMYLQGARGLSPIEASLLMVPGYVVGAFAAPLAGRLADRLGPVLPATAGLAVQSCAMIVFAQMTISSGLWIAAVGNVISTFGGAAFYPANNSAVMKASPPRQLGIASGVLRTFASVGMVFSFTTVILIASRSISRQTAFAIFIGTTSLRGRLATSFITGLHTAFYAMVGIMVLAAVLSAMRGRGRPGSAGAPGEAAKGTAS